jgi:hypothetical protein
MDATRKRRTKDRARQTWYAGCRQRRFARFLGFGGDESASPGYPATRSGTGAWLRLEPLSPDHGGVERSN